MRLDDLSHPRLCATPVGADHSRAVVAGLKARLKDHPPEAAGRVTLLVNSARTARRMAQLWAEDGAVILPRIRMLTELSAGPEGAELPAAVPPLAQTLRLSQLVAALIAQSPDLAPATSRFALTESLSELLAEMQEEGVTPDDIRALDVGEHARHFQRLKTFLDIVTPHFADANLMTVERRQRAVIDGLIRRWKDTPPDHPVVVAGSTGSRGGTFALMQAVTRLPKGLVILPGIDPHLPPPVWRAVLGGADGDGAEDHPQYRIGRLATALGLDPGDLPLWSDGGTINSARNALVSLALRPAPVTDQWRAEGPALQQIATATADVTLLEAPGLQAEAATIALRLRAAAETGERAALITPDRELTRLVTAALDRWGIRPDDSAGRPLALSAPGRLLRHLAQAMGRPLTAEALAILLKHPLTHTGADRGQHILWTGALERRYLRGTAPFPTMKGLRDWAEDQGDGAVAWVTWIGDVVLALGGLGHGSLSDLADHLLRAAEALAAGPGMTGPGELWDQEAGRKAQGLLGDLVRHASEGGDLSAADFSDLLSGLLNSAEVRIPVAAHPDIMIWGPIEARVQGADLVILAGLNDQTWPGPAPADPWLNRALRANAGLLRPDRSIGLAAHDVQQAMGARQLWLTRALRDAETATVPSRWLNRLTNLLGGATAETAEALAEMRARAAGWQVWAETLGRPDATMADDPRLKPASRPAPVTPVEHRPTRLSVTRIETLIRDPYAIYASQILGLRALDPLRQSPDAPLRGTILHDILHRFVDRTREALPDDAAAHLMAITDEVLEERAPWPAARRLWRARLGRVAAWFVATEAERRDIGRPGHLEVRGQWTPKGQTFTLTGTADRIDVSEDGRLLIYDYKTGSVPTENQEKSFNQQLWLEALMAANGGFEGIGAAEVDRMAYVGLGGEGKIRTVFPDSETLAKARDGLFLLMDDLLDPAFGFASRKAAYREGVAGDYDHLARHGEWSGTAEPVAVPVGR